MYDLLDTLSVTSEFHKAKLPSCSCVAFWNHIIKTVSDKELTKFLGRERNCDADVVIYSNSSFCSRVQMEGLSLNMT